LRGDGGEASAVGAADLHDPIAQFHARHAGEQRVRLVLASKREHQQ
jgi:hypothetical protein